MIEHVNGFANPEAVEVAWQKFKNESDVKIADNEKRVGEFRRQAHRINKRLKSVFNWKVSGLEHKNNILKQIMKAYTDDKANREAQFANDFNKRMRELN